jgi:hypothetical protein
MENLLVDLPLGVLQDILGRLDRGSLGAAASSCKAIRELALLETSTIRVRCTETGGGAALGEERCS